MQMMSHLHDLSVELTMKTIIHKDKGLSSRCGIYKFGDVRVVEYSYYWKKVTCLNCLKFGLKKNDLRAASAEYKE